MCDVVEVEVEAVWMDKDKVVCGVCRLAALGFLLRVVGALSPPARIASDGASGGATGELGGW
jgi:hypothetical protein